MRVVPVLLVLCAAVGFAPACKSSAEKRAEREAAWAARKAAIPADSPLAKLEMGMSETEVMSALGPPTSIGGHITGKQFIPFNFSQKDVQRTVYLYKGIGRVEFSYGGWGQRNGVVDLYHDPGEPGAR